MKPIPEKLGTAKIVCYTPIDHRHRFTGKTKQIINGKMQGQMAGLAICQYPEDDGFYLFGCDSDWRIVTDTWHQTLEHAQEQAEFEYAGASATWTFPN